MQFYKILLQEVCLALDLDIKDVLSKSRDMDCVYARSIYIHERLSQGVSSLIIGKELNRDRVTCYNQSVKYPERYKYDPLFRRAADRWDEHYRKMRRFAWHPKLVYTWYDDGNAIALIWLRHYYRARHCLFITEDGRITVYDILDVMLASKNPIMRLIGKLLSNRVKKYETNEQS